MFFLNLSLYFVKYFIIYTYMTIEIIKTVKSKKSHNTINHKQKDYITRKAKAVSLYIAWEGSTRDIEKKTWITRSVISREAKNEIQNNLKEYTKIAETAKKNVSFLNDIIRDSKDEIKGQAKSINDFNVISDIALKQQRLVSLIEWVKENETNKNTPNIINIQVNNYKDTE